MPVINGVKMACASCIRGHRSTSCQHLDRPMLEVRKKGRPLTQCDHCRDLRRVKQVHVRCMCKPDESPAPKRVNKTKEKNRPVEEEERSNCDCDNTGVCNCAVPRAAVSKTGRRYSARTEPAELVPPVAIQPHSDSTSPACTQDGCSSGDDSNLTSGSSHCTATAVVDLTPPSSSSVFPSSPLQIAPPPVDAFNTTIRPSSSHFDPLEAGQRKDDSSLPSHYQLRTQSKSQRYTPYPQSLPSAPLSYALTGPSPFVNNPLYDPDPVSEEVTTAQMWDQFLRDELPSSDTTVTEQPPSNPPSSHTQLRCSCGPDCVCGSCATTKSSTSTTLIDSSQQPSAPSSIIASDPSPYCSSSSSIEPSPSPSQVDCFDCSVLLAALDLLDEDVVSSVTAASGFSLPQLQVLQKDAQDFVSTYTTATPPAFSLSQAELFQYANFLTATVDRPEGVGFKLLSSKKSTAASTPGNYITPSASSLAATALMAIPELSPPPPALPLAPSLSNTMVRSTSTETFDLGACNGSCDPTITTDSTSKCSCGPGCTCITCSGNTAGMLDLPGDTCHKASCGDCAELDQTLSQLHQCLEDQSSLAPGVEPK